MKYFTIFWWQIKNEQITQANFVYKIRREWRAEHFLLLLLLKKHDKKSLGAGGWKNISITSRRYCISTADLDLSPPGWELQTDFFASLKKCVLVCQQHSKQILQTNDAKNFDSYLQRHILRADESGPFIQTPDVNDKVHIGWWRHSIIYGNCHRRQQITCANWFQCSSTHKAEPLDLADMQRKGVISNKIYINRQMTFR